VELSAVLSLRDRLSAKMKKASEGVGAMTKRVNESKEALVRMSQSQNINISARTNIAEVMRTAKLEMASLKNTIEEKEIALKVHLDDGLNMDKIEGQLNHFGALAETGEDIIQTYSDKLDILKQKQAEFTDKTKVSTKLGVEQSIDSLEKKLAEIESAKQKFTEWQKIRADFSVLEEARSKLAAMEKSVEDLNKTNVAVRAYVDFKDDALKQVYDIDEKIKSLGKKVITPVINLKDRVTNRIKPIASRLKGLSNQKIQPLAVLKDKVTNAVGKVRQRLAKVAGTVAYPVVKLKDMASPLVSKITGKIKKVTGKIWAATVKVIDKTGPALKKIGSGLKSVAGIAAKGIVIGATVAMAGATAATATSISKDQAVNSTLAQTGYNADDYKAEFGDIMSNLYRDNMGEDYADLGKSISTVAQISGETGKNLEGLTHNALLLRDTFDFDVTESVRSAKMMMDQFGISGDEAYNLIAQGAQYGLNKNGDLLDTLNEYGTHFKQMGFSSTEMMNMLVNGAQSGTFSVDKLGDAIKEFGIRSKDGSDGTKQAFKDLGLDANRLTKDFAAGGAKGKAAFQEVTAALGTMQDPVKQNAAGVALFGTMWEDLGAKGVLSMSQLNGEIQGGTDALTEINNIKYDDLGSAFGSLKRTFTDAVLEPIGKKLTPVVSDAVNVLKGFAGRIGKAIESGDTSEIGNVFNDMIGTGVQAVQDGAPKMIKALIGGLGGYQKMIRQQAPSIITAATTIILTLVQGLTQAMPDLAETSISILESFTQGISGNLPMIIQAAVQLLTSLIQGFVSMLPAILNLGLQLLLSLIQGIVQSLPLLIDSAVQIVLNLLQFITDNLPMIIQAALDIIMTLVQALIDNIPVLVDGAIQIITGLVSFIIENLPMILEAAIQLVVALVNGLISALPTLVEGALNLVSAIWDTLKGVDWLQLGIDLIKGIGEGLLSGVKQIGSTIGNVAGSIVGKFKNFLGIHSPSRVMKAEVGFNMGAGVAEGLKDTKAMLNNEIESLTDDMTVTMSANTPEVVIPSMKPYQLPDPEESEKPSKPKNPSGGSDEYSGLDIAQPINNSNTSNSYSSSAESKVEKKYFIEKIIEYVEITGEGDEDRLVQKILAALADDIEETADNMGEEAVD